MKLERPVLIPRFESEYMIDILIQKIKQKYSEPQNIRFIEFGCGSGALGLSLSKEMHMRGIMVDIKGQCIKLAKDNLTINHISPHLLEFIEEDMSKCLHLGDEVEVVISNPPYLSMEHY